MKRPVYIASSAILLLSSVGAAQHVSARSAHAFKYTIRLCTSTPVGVPADRQLSQGIEHGAAIASSQMRGALARYGILVQTPLQLNDGAPDGSSYSTDVEHQNAIKCVNNPQVIGYVGTLNTGAAVVSEPVLNRAHMVMISPANTGPGLTTVKPYQGYGGRRSEEPATFYHHIPWPTYYRTVTTDALQGPAGAIFAHNRLHAKTFFLVDDKLTYGVGLGQTFRAAAQKMGMRNVGYQEIDSSSTAAEAQTSQSIAKAIIKANPDVVYCGCDAETSGPLPLDLRRAGYRKPFMGGDALENTAWITKTATTVGAFNNYATSVGPPPTATSGAFRNLYKKQFPGFFKSPGIQSYDAPSFDAAKIILTAVLHAAQHHQFFGNVMHRRTMTVKFVRFISYWGATGHTRFDKNGDTTNRILSVYQANTSNKTWQFRQEIRPKGYVSAP